jgi:hypothetical protein
MKHLSTIIIVSFFGLMIFASCKKDYTCKCTVTISGTANGIPFSESADSTIALGKMKKKDAKSKCDQYESDAKKEIDAAAAISGGTLSGSASCDIKK